jgi:PAS domain S-box-containing protein
MGRTISAERLAAARTAANATLEHEIAERQHAEEALRQAEQKYRDIFEHAREGIYQTTSDGRFLVANSALAYMLGFDTPAELIHECTDIAQQCYVDPAGREEFKRLLEEHGAIQGFEYQAYRRDGSKVWVSNNARAVHDERGAILYYEGIIQNITERKHAEEARQASSRRLLETQEAERQRIARELHDEIGQVLTAVKISLQIVRDASKQVATLPYIDESMEVVDEALSRVRDLSLDLHPSMLDDLGLPAALRWYVDRYAQRTGIIAEVMTDGVEAGGRLPREIETPCFRIVQEALTNVARHAHARHVVVHLRRLRTTLRVEIKDDGVGFDTSALKHKTAADIFGLRGMEERALLVGGRLRILSAPSRGTKIRAYFPLRIMEH